MKGDTVLDVVVFQLTAPRTRCELFVSANGMTEKLASGFLKPFLNHLKTVEEQVVRGCESVKLERPQSYQGRSWFTKGTLERFVRFVSTPEVLERVKFIEDELAQLEQVRGIQASSLLQVEDSYSAADPVYQRNDGNAFSGQSGKFGSSKLPQIYPYDAVDNGRETSKVELLRAMDVRLLALRQEQSTAFGRAAAAGFNSDNMTDLIAFSEYFGADRLRVACFNFLIVLQRRVIEPVNLSPQAVSSSCDTLVSLSKMNILPKQEVFSQTNLKPGQGGEAVIPNVGCHIEDERIPIASNGTLPVFDKESRLNGVQSRGSGGSEARKRWGPPEKIRPELFVDHDRRDSGLLTLSGVSANDCLGAHSINRNDETDFPIKVKVITQGATEWQDPVVVDHVQGHGLMVQDMTVLKLDQSIDPQISLKDEQSPSSKISLSPGSAPEFEGSTIGQGHSSSTLPDEQTSSIVEPTCKSDLSAVSSSGLAPARRLSVQDAISLFEDKQKRELVEASRKQCTGKHESGRPSLEGTNALSFACTGPRRWSVANSNDVGKRLQKELTSNKQEATRMSSESVRSNGDALLARQEKNKFEPHSNGFSQKASNTALEQPCVDKASAKACDNSLESEAQDPVQPKLVPLAMQESSIKNASSKKKGDDQKLIIPSPGREQVDAESEQIVKDASTMVSSNSDMPGTIASGRESLGRFRVDSSQKDMQNGVRNQLCQKHSDLGEQNGRFYEHYRKLRDAKLNEVNEFKKAEREAKLRLMEETLLLRKAELDAQTIKLSTRNYQQVRAAKLQARKADLQTFRKEDAVDESSKELSSHSKGRSTSPPSIRLAGKDEASTSKPLNGRKSSAVSRKGATPPRSSNRGTSLSPKLTPRSVTSSTIKPRRSVGSGGNDNPLAKSVPSFANLRKENTKPSGGRPSGNTGLQSKDGGSGRFRALNEAHPLETNGNILVCTPPPGNGPSKDKGVPLVWKSKCDSREILPSDDSASVQLKNHRDVGCEAGAPSSLKKVQQFSKEGGIFAPKSVLDINEQMRLIPFEPCCCHEERTLNTPLFRLDGTNENDISVEETDTKDVGDETMETDTYEANFSMEVQTIPTTTASSEKNPEIDAPFGTIEAYQQTSFRTDIGSTHQLYVSGHYLEGNHELDGNPHPLSGKAFQTMYVADASSSFRASSLPHEHHLPVFVNGPVSPPDSRVEQVQIGTVSGHFSPSVAAGLESPLRSPAYWNASKTQYVAGPQKVASVISTREPAKGFKKLLKFGRKNRAPDPSTSDWASTSATSEGDDESEEQRFSTDGNVAKGSRLDESRAINTKGEQYITPNKTLTAQSLRSSIPTPPANFKLRDDHLVGGTMLKAPKSFFSLSSFRSRGTEGRA